MGAARRIGTVAILCFVRMALPGGARLGPYRVLCALGAGGMGEVYKARDTRLDRVVALKVLPAEYAADPDRRAGLEREARAVAALSHPHIGALFDIGQDRGIDFLVMEYLDGETLSARLARKGSQTSFVGQRAQTRRVSSPGLPLREALQLPRISQTRWLRPTGPASSIATSSPATSCSRGAVGNAPAHSKPRCSTLVWPVGHLTRTSPVKLIPARQIS